MSQTPLGSAEQESFADLEIRILGPQEEGYLVELTLDREQVFRTQKRLRRDVDTWISTQDPALIGQNLFKALVDDTDLKNGWCEVRGKAPRRRLRLWIEPEAARLHTLPWELIHDGQSLLSAHLDTPFSRYLPIALPWSGPVDERPIRVLVIISDPTDLEDLPRVDAELEQNCLQDAFKDADPRQLQVEFLLPPATLRRIEEKLTEGNFHVLHYLGHGAYDRSRGRAWLFMQDEEGLTQHVYDDQLTRMLSHHGIRPRLVCLVACETAAGSTANALMGLAPKLVRAGVPAVVAIQERISLESARTFESCFFKHLLDHGLVDLAVNQARNTLLTAGQADAMAPVLFMRLRSGSLWGGEADTRGEVLGTSQPRVFWNRLVKQIQAGKCTPILGPRVHGDLLPSMPEIAEHWADTKEYQYPFPNRREMAGVAQYVALWTGEHYTRDQLIDTLMEHVRARLPESPPSGDGTDTLAGLIQAADWQVLVADNPNEVHRVLAKLDLPVYLTTNIDSSMVEALKARGRNPARSFCRWNERLDSLDSPLGATDEKAATVEQPLVYHLLGSDQEVESVVLSEDHYFSWLVRICAERDRIPLSIRERLSTTTLMFVGYGVYDWEFRVLLHGLVRNLTNRFDLQHVAVQMEPASEEGATSEPVRRFLERYLGKADIDVYWGSLPQFVAELREHWEGR